MDYRTLSIRRDGSVEHLTLDRPDVRNAFNPALIAELTDWATGMAGRHDVRAAVLAGAGKAFSAGADLAWMAESASYTHEENVRDARRLAALFEALDTLPVPLIGRVHGAALGGGAGLVAVCDIVVADAHTVFGFTEVKLGLVPAAISPYVIAKIGRSAARELFLTGARFNASRAREIGLVHALAAAGELDAIVAGYLREVLSAGPEAVRTAKVLTRQVAAAQPGELAELTAHAIATRRVSAEGREGLGAFLEKRPPRWMEPL
ncbi:MAG: enoyl-CoA hydratase-related protein [Bacteroidales bacterium]